MLKKFYVIYKLEHKTSGRIHYTWDIPDNPKAYLIIKEFYLQNNNLIKEKVFTTEEKFNFYWKTQRDW